MLAELILARIAVHTCGPAPVICYLISQLFPGGGVYHHRPHRISAKVDANDQIIVIHIIYLHGK
ncbi:hypothetical protein [Neomoorella glycerini]|uniref:hypothetical protein n=1 Tax=Neomoorella glycerini TaxID=55779 RepID=UPI0012E0EB71|nr:hypothetical protein [Moorella glycerini]